ncbi:MAG: hypothetical protein SFW65_02615 [Alphaproteobacteria bacterium]|nr:hypothetical protein [Alphaproteobacteria bacterium]
MDDETLLQTLKNGLMIAGHEMGPVGDHWPAIHAISKGMEKEFTQKQTDEAVLGELEFHFADILHRLEEKAKQATPEGRKIILEFVKEKWEEYYSIFEPIDAKHMPKSDDLVVEGVNEYSNVSAAFHIINNLGVRS